MVLEGALRGRSRLPRMAEGPDPARVAVSVGSLVGGRGRREDGARGG